MHKKNASPTSRRAQRGTNVRDQNNKARRAINIWRDFFQYMKDACDQQGVKQKRIELMVSRYI